MHVRDHCEAGTTLSVRTWDYAFRRCNADRSTTRPGAVWCHRQPPPCRHPGFEYVEKSPGRRVPSAKIPPNHPAVQPCSAN